MRERIELQRKEYHHPLDSGHGIIMILVAGTHFEKGGPPWQRWKQSSVELAEQCRQTKPFGPHRQCGAAAGAGEQTTAKLADGMGSAE